MIAGLRVVVLLTDNNECWTDLSDGESDTERVLTAYDGEECLKHETPTIWRMFRG